MSSRKSSNKKRQRSSELSNVHLSNTVGPVVPRKKLRQEKEKEPTKKKNTSDHSTLLQNRVFSVSSTCPAGDQFAYKAVIALVKSLGGKISPTVHKRVYAVLATEESISKQTQRVRKAVKKNIPLLRPEYLLESQTQNQMLPLKEYIYPEEVVQKLIDDAEAAEEIEAKRVAQIADAMGEDDQEDVVVENGTLADIADKPTECYCSCHELNTPDCPWCPDC